MVVEEWTKVKEDEMYDLLRDATKATIANCDLKELIFNFNGEFVRITGSFDCLHVWKLKSEEDSNDKS